MIATSADRFGGRRRSLPGLTCRCDKGGQRTEPGQPGLPDPAGHENPAGQSDAPGRPWPRRASDPWQEWLRRAEQLAAWKVQSVPTPAWMRKTPGERRWPVTLSVLAAIVLQVLLPPHLTRPLPPSLLPALEGALLLGLTIATPVRIERRRKAGPAASLGLNLPGTAP